MTEYYIPAGNGESEYVEKRSRFLGHVIPAATEDEARDFVAAMKKKYYDARHNCWCYIIKDGAVRYSDDGEPQGSAGLPMLEVFKREGIENVVCVVTRYFGGVLLGTGGLFRAYTKAAKDALNDAGVCVVRRWVSAQADCPYPLLERLKGECELIGGIVSDVEYSADVRLTFLIPEENANAFALRVTELSAGQSKLILCGEEYKAVKIK